MSEQTTPVTKVEAPKIVEAPKVQQTDWTGLSLQLKGLEDHYLSFAGKPGFNPFYPSFLPKVLMLRTSIDNGNRSPELEKSIKETIAAKVEPVSPVEKPMERLKLNRDLQALREGK